MTSLLAALVLFSPPIDRQALVRRHNVVLTKPDLERPLQVGNGEFAFGMDITGLQTFAPFNTMSHWGWHTSPLPAGQHPEDFEGQTWDTHGRPVRYPMPDPKHPEISNWMAGNPHRINLGRLGLTLLKKDGKPAVAADLTKTRQTLDLWTGIATSRFELEGEPVTVTTACHPTLDAVAVKVESPLVKEGRVSAFLTCPGNNPLAFANFVGDWSHPGRFEPLGTASGSRADFVRRLDKDDYYASLTWSKGASLQAGTDQVALSGGSGSGFSFVCEFSPSVIRGGVPDAEAAFALSRREWPKYWRSGGAIDLSGTPDPRAKELERRIVLSQYLMRVNGAGSWPAQESGLVNNGWFGRFHLEMVWWHEAHWALWGRDTLADRDFKFYSKVLPGAKKLAASQGYKGARWPKCIGPNMQEWPHEIHALLIWQQPHPIFFAEMDYRAHPTRATLEKWRPIVEATADFLASYAFLDPQTGRYILGPPMDVVSENTDPKITSNPTFELSYWRFGLRTALAWQERLGQKANPAWEKVLRHLAPLPQQDGVYVLHEGVEDMWTKFAFEHPALTGAYGLLPGDGVDSHVMRRTLDKIGKSWNFGHVWGWDFPMLAMCAARLGEPSKAVDYLLYDSPNFQFDERGLATGGPFPYFPSNGGLLYAVAFMAKGWDGAPPREAPGFPMGWHVRWEGLRRAL